MKFLKKHQKQCGFTLIEAVIALGLGAAAIYGTLQIQIGLDKLSNTAVASAAVLELQREITMHLKSGCTDILENESMTGQPVTMHFPATFDGGSFLANDVSAGFRLKDFQISSVRLTYNAAIPAQNAANMRYTLLEVIAQLNTGSFLGAPTQRIEIGLSAIPIGNPARVNKCALPSTGEETCLLLGAASTGCDTSRLTNAVISGICIVAGLNFEFCSENSPGYINYGYPALNALYGGF